MQRWLTVCVAGWVAVGSAAGQQTKDGKLHVYFADVEGGQATLFVAPGGESLLVDTGNPGNGAHDAKRVLALAQRAGLKEIDTVLITHYHTDHVGGLPELAAMIPIRRVVDHGPNTETSGPGSDATVRAYGGYQSLMAGAAGGRKIGHEVLKPGDRFRVGELRVEMVSAAGKLIEAPLAGAGEANPACATSPVKELEHDENDMSMGSVLTFGSTRILDLGDLTWGAERGLVCPVNKIGQVDLYVASHHGLDRSGSPALVDAVAPRVAVMDNSGIKGDAPVTFEIVQQSPRIAQGALWQLHKAVGNDAAHNVPEERIANLVPVKVEGGKPVEDDAGFYLEAIVGKDGTIGIYNSRTGATVEYRRK